MRKLLVSVLVLNAALLAGRFWRELPVNAQGVGENAACEADRTLHSVDSNGDGSVDLSDGIHLLTWLFSGGPQPRVCLAQTSLEGRVAALEGTVATLSEVLTSLKRQVATLDATVGALNEALASLEGRVAAIKDTALTEEQREILGHLSIVQIPTDDQGNTAKTIRVSAVNVQIVNGLGATNGNPDDPNSADPGRTTTNGLGNLIVGYNEDRALLRGGPLCSTSPADCGDDRTGSHNIVIASGLNYSHFGGLVIGQVNAISAPYSAVSGGSFNTASGGFSSISGGLFNTASGSTSSVSGGVFNTASGRLSSVSGGTGNTASGNVASVSGGRNNTASSGDSSVSGGRRNTASGGDSSVSGGRDNTASGFSSSVSGGRFNRAIGDQSSVSGGGAALNANFGNKANGLLSSVSGGNNQEANGDFAHPNTHR